MPEAYIAVGSNIEPEKNIPLALIALNRAVTVQAVSTFYRTAPLNRPEQSSYYNGIFRIECEASVRELKFAVLRPIETSLGRVRNEDRYAPRPIDLDIVLYGDQVVNEPGIVIPDPDIFTRPFIAYPLLEIAPDLVVPGTQIPLSSTEVSKATDGLYPLQKFSHRLREQIQS